MAFYEIVKDQAVNLNPFGDEPDLRPRMEGWLAVCEAYNVPKDRRAELVDTARLIFDGARGRVTVPGLRLLPPEVFREPTPEDLDV